MATYTNLTNIRGPRGPQGLPGPGAVPADEAVAGFVQLDSDTRTALLAGFTRRTVINVLDHGAVGDWDTVGLTGTDNLAAFDAAAAAAVASAEPCTIVIPPGDYWLSDNWLLDGDDIEVQCSPQATIRTTSATTTGAAVTFMGGGVMSPNEVVTPKRNSFRWTGGTVIATGSGNLDNGLGVVRVERCHVSDLTVDADRRALTAQYGIHNLVFERIRVARGGVTGIDVWSDIRNATIRDVEVTTSPMALQIAALNQTPEHRNANITVERFVALANTGAVGINVKDSDNVTLRDVTVPGQLDAARSTVTLHNCITDSQVFGTGIGARPAVPIVLSGLSGWTAFGAGYASPTGRLGADGYVQLNGAIKGGTLAAGTQILALPLGLRSIAGHKPRFTVPCLGAAGGVADVYVDGSLVLLSTAVAGATLLALDGIRFPGA